MQQEQLELVMGQPRSERYMTACSCQINKKFGRSERDATACSCKMNKNNGRGSLVVLVGLDVVND